MKLICLILLVSLQIGIGQDFNFVRSLYIDDLRSWELLDSNENYVGKLEARWVQDAVSKEWDFRVGEKTGFFSMRHVERPHEWEYRSDYAVYTIKPRWLGDLHSWTVTNNDVTYSISVWPDEDGFQWKLLDNSNKQIALFYNTYINDYLDWELLQNEGPNNKDIPLILSFLGVFYSQTQFRR